MRINRYVALATGLSRRAADTAITAGRVRQNQRIATLGTEVVEGDIVTLDDQPITKPSMHQTIMLNKPVGYICSREGQGGKTIYDLIPASLRSLKPIGRLDKNSSGLLLLTDDGNLAHSLTHPSFHKIKIYKITLEKNLADEDQTAIKKGIMLEDGASKLRVEGKGTDWTVTMHEGRNRQIRRTFAALGYQVVDLHRVRFGTYVLGQLDIGKYKVL